MEQERFRILIWNRCLPLLAAPVLGFMLYISPLSDGWSRGTWIGVGAAGAALAGLYLANAWRKAQIFLDERGITVFISSWQTYRWDQLLKVREIGAYRVRMCFDAGVEDKHWHVTVDVVRSEAFVDALLDWYAETTGQELPANDESEHAA